MSDQSWTVRLDGQLLPDKKLIGGKAWSIAWMKTMDLPVPPAFVISTKACLGYLANNAFPDGLDTEIKNQMAWLEGQLDRHFGGADKPLLLSVRSGAAISMPGMMDTVLNLGINDVTEKALAEETGNPQFARDTHRRFYELYSAIVLKIPGIELDPDQTPQDWRVKIESLGGKIPESVNEQLRETVLAVFNSWNTRRAKRYREHNGIAHDLGTAVTVQAMVFGNLDDRSGTGVLFSRNPLTGENVPYGEYLPKAQGEDVVSGKFTPLPLDAMKEFAAESYSQLLAAASKLETANQDAQDIEFTVQQGTLYLLQARSAKRAPAAAVRMAVEMVAEGLIDEAVALTRVTAEQVRTLLLPRLADGAAVNAPLLVTGEGACPGVAFGTVVSDSDEAEQRAKKGEKIILARKTTSPDDVHGMIAACGVITEMGGSTSHAAVVSRALGRPCVVGTGEGSLEKLSGQKATIVGDEGKVYAGELEVIAPEEEADPLLSKLICWSRERSSIQVLSSRDAGSMDAVLDLDAIPEASEPDVLADLLANNTAVKGDILASEDVTRLAIQAGVKIMYTRPVLPSLLMALEGIK
ncbi:MAG: pyruvate, phosphate dikinase [Porticoccaceae bacterium]